MRYGSGMLKQSNPDRRGMPRLKSLMAATISFNHGQSVIDCLIRNLSQAGAKLIVSRAVALPDCFDLLIPQKQATRRARIEWRRDDEVGVSFEGSSALRPDGEAGEEALRRRIRALEAEIERLQTRIGQLTSG